MKYGYARVSTTIQNLDSQIDALKKEKVEEEHIFREKYTGTRKDRPELQKVLHILSEGDTLIVTKLDRLARNTKEGLEIIQDLFDRGVKVHVLNVGLLENTTMGKFFLQTMLAVAEMERNMFLDRSAEGKAIAKKMNPQFKEGRPRKYSRDQLDLAIELKRNHSYKEVEKKTGISKSTIIREMRKRGINNDDLRSLVDQITEDNKHDYIKL